ncbi:hypothetical protein MKX01_042478 [Papaver californicum]|nr:hypothetical protein MKX01_042478 [Papaver californicum]
MAITKRSTPRFFSSSSVFAVLAYLFISTVMMASAWKNICVPGDIYIDSQAVVKRRMAVCIDCTVWCMELCLDLGTSTIDHRCRVPSYSTVQCKCCCERLPHSSSPPPPPLPLPPPLDPADDFSGPAPYEYDICMPGQTYLKIKRERDGDCVSNCNGFPVRVYEWYEQCCCGNFIPSLPPPSPSPPPPTPQLPSPSPPGPSGGRETYRS